MKTRRRAACGYSNLISVPAAADRRGSSPPMHHSLFGRRLRRRACGAVEFAGVEDGCAARPMRRRSLGQRCQCPDQRRQLPRQAGSPPRDSCPGRNATPRTCGVVRCRSGAVTDRCRRNGPGSAEPRYALPRARDTRLVRELIPTHRRAIASCDAIAAGAWINRARVRRPGSTGRARCRCGRPDRAESRESRCGVPRPSSAARTGRATRSP